MPRLTAAAIPPSIYSMVPVIAFENADDAALFRIVWGE